MKAASFWKCLFLRKYEIFILVAGHIDVALSQKQAIYKRKDGIFCRITATASHFTTFCRRYSYFLDNIL